MKYLDETETTVIISSTESCVVTRQDVQDYIAAGGVIEPAFTLDGLKLKKGFALWRDMSPGYLYKHYDAGTQATFLARYIKLMVDPVGNAVKLAKLDAVDAWMKQVLLYYYGKKATIIAAQNNATLNAITWDFPAGFDATDPLVTIPEVI